MLRIEDDEQVFNRGNFSPHFFIPRFTNSTLHSFRGQFVKMLKAMYDEYLPELANSKEEDVQVGQCKPAGYFVSVTQLDIQCLGLTYT